MSTGQPKRPEKSATGTSPAKHHLICHECYICSHAALECILPQRDQMQTIVNYETLSPAEVVAVPASLDLRAKQLFGFPEQDKSAGSTGATTQSQSTAAMEQGNV